MAYDLNFTNNTAAFIKSSGPLYLQTNSPADNLDLTLSAANAGQVIIDDSAQVTGSLSVGASLTTTNLFVGSTTLVANLNTDLLDGYHVTNLPFVNAATNGTLTKGKLVT